MKKLPITKEQFNKSKYFNNKYGKLKYVSESGKLFKTSKGKILKFKESTKKFGRKFTKESSTDDLYVFYEWLKSCTEMDSGIHVKLYDNEDGSGSVEMRFDDRYQWDDDVENGELPKDEDSGVKDWIAQFERKAEKNGWEFNMDEYEDEFSLTLRDSNEYQESVGEAKWAVVVDDEIDQVFDSRDAAEEYASSLEEDGVDALVRRMTETKSLDEGTESNPRFKCMEGYNHEYDDDILKFRDDVINALDQFYDGKYYVGPGMDSKSIQVTDHHTGIDFQLDISVSNDVEM